MAEAFEHARVVHHVRTQGGEKSLDHVERMEFRLFLAYLRYFFELYSMFDQLDRTKDARINLDEFLGMQPQLAAWGVVVSEPEVTFSEIDCDGDDLVTWHEFADFAIHHQLHREVDYDEAEAGAKEVEEAARRQLDEIVRENVDNMKHVRPGQSPPKSPPRTPRQKTPRSLLSAR